MAGHCQALSTQHSACASGMAASSASRRRKLKSGIERERGRNHLSSFRPITGPLAQSTHPRIQASTPARLARRDLRSSATFALHIYTQTREPVTLSTRRRAVRRRRSPSHMPCVRSSSSVCPVPRPRPVCCVSQRCVLVPDQSHTPRNERNHKAQTDSPGGNSCHVQLALQVKVQPAPSEPWRRCSDLPAGASIFPSTTRHASLPVH